METIASVITELGNVSTTAHGKILENKFELDLNNFQPEHGSSFTF